MIAFFIPKSNCIKPEMKASEKERVLLSEFQIRKNICEGRKRGELKSRPSDNVALFIFEAQYLLSKLIFE